MPPIPTDNLDLLKRAAVAQVRQRREQYLRALDEFRTMFAQYEKLGMPTLSSEIEVIREER